MRVCLCCARCVMLLLLLASVREFVSLGGLTVVGRGGHICKAQGFQSVFLLVRFVFCLVLCCDSTKSIDHLTSDENFVFCVEASERASRREREREVVSGRWYAMWCLTCCLLCQVLLPRTQRCLSRLGSQGGGASENNKY